MGRLKVEKKTLDTYHPCVHEYNSPTARFSTRKEAQCTAFASQSFSRPRIAIFFIFSFFAI